MASLEGGNMSLGMDIKHPDKKTCEKDLHAALNPDICEPVAKEQIDGGDTEGVEEFQNIEIGSVNPNAVIDREESLSKRLQGTAHKVAKVMMLVTALSSLSVFSNDAEAGQYRYYKDTPRAEHKERNNSEQPERLRLTNASKWAGEKVRGAQNDLKEIKTAQDAEWLVRLYVDGFANEFYMPSKGSSNRPNYNAPSRIYTIDDAKYAIECAKILKGIMENLHGKYGVGKYEDRQARLDKVIVNLKQQTSYSFQKEQEAMRNIMERFRMNRR